MKPRWLHILLFAVVMIVAVTALRFALGTFPGLAVLATVLVIRLLGFLYQAMHALTTTLWDATGTIAGRIRDDRERRAAQKEARHAARLL